MALRKEVESIVLPSGHRRYPARAIEALRSPETAGADA
ncbi:hypothetical protein [Bacillus subtilis]